MRCTWLQASCISLGVLRLSLVSKGFIVTGTSRLMRHRASISEQRDRCATLTMGAAGKKRKKVRWCLNMFPFSYCGFLSQASKVVP